MAYTGQNIFDMALERSDLNNEDLVPSAQIIQYINNFQRRAYLRAARINPDYFGTSADTATRTAYTDDWNLESTPGNIAAVLKAEIKSITGTVTGLAVGDKVNLVSIRWPSMEINPRAVLRGRRLSGYGAELGAADANMVTALTVYYSPLPLALPSLEASLMLPEEWADLVVLPLAKVLSLRDGRLEEIEALELELRDVQTMFDEALLVYDHGLARPLSSTPAIPVVPRG